jgi:uncharacterized protein
MSIIINNVEKYVTSLLQSKLPQSLTFHNCQHTKNVVYAVKHIGKKSRISAEELEIVTIAAWFHDTGFTVTYSGHEEESIKIAANHLSLLKYENRKVQKVLDCIQATKLPQQPLDLVGEVLCDADLFHLSQHNFL